MTATIGLFSKTQTGVTFTAGETIFTVHQPADHMYIVLDGQVEIRQNDCVLAIAGPGEPIGEMALINNAARSATAIARTDCRLEPVDERRFQFMLEHTPFFALQMMRVLVERLSRSNAVQGVTN